MAPDELPDRYIEGGGLGLDLYRDVAELPLVSPHGHIDVRLFSRPDARLEPPGRLFVTSDHYVVRMLYSQGVPLEATRGEDRDVWRLLVDNADLFALTPSGLWLRETLAGVFGIHELTLDAYDAIEAQLASPEFAPRALLDRFGVECLATTDPAAAPLDDHRGLAPRIRPTFRPDAVVALDAPGWREAIAELGVDDYASFIDALVERRLAFKAMGATATDHAATSADTTRLANADATRLFARALAGDVSSAEARSFEAHMLNEFARMSLDDGLVMQLHVGSFRDHNAPLAARFGADLGADIPVATDWTRGLRPLLRGLRQRPGLHADPVHTGREHVQPRARSARRPLPRRPARMSVVVPRQPARHRPFPRPRRRDGRRPQPGRLRR